MAGTRRLSLASGSPHYTPTPGRRRPTGPLFRNVDGNPWVPVLPSDTVTSKRDGKLRVLVDASVDVADVLASARRVGEVTAFSFEPPSLTDLFLAAVSEGERS